MTIYTFNSIKLLQSHLDSHKTIKKILAFKLGLLDFMNVLDSS